MARSHALGASVGRHNFTGEGSGYGAGGEGASLSNELASAGLRTNRNEHNCQGTGVGRLEHPTSLFPAVQRQAFASLSISPGTRSKQHATVVHGVHVARGGCISPVQFLPERLAFTPPLGHPKRVRNLLAIMGPYMKSKFLFLCFDITRHLV